MRVRVLAASAAVIFVALLACGKDDRPAGPTLVLDRDSLGFGQEFDTGVYVGTSKQESLMIQNQGREDLVISGVDFAGDSAFAMELSDKMTVPAGERTFIRFTFTPPAAQMYAATATIHSNAINAPDKVVELTGRGVDPNASPDAGM